MNYNSWIFWLLFAAVFVCYWRLTHRGQNTLLLVASYVFYGFWDYRFLFLILISTVIDFIGGLGVAGVRLAPTRLVRLGLLIIGSSFLLCTPIHFPQLFQGLKDGDSAVVLGSLPQHPADFNIVYLVALVTIGYGLALPKLYALPVPTRRRVFLTISMLANLAILGFFKYCDFFIVSMKDLTDALGWAMSLQTLGIILPAGISFYTFQAMSYTIDIYRGETEPTEHFGDFALFVCFFPHLVAGPIMRAHTLLPQVVQPHSLKPGAMEEGLYLVLIGLFKKLVVADNLAPIANAVFSRFKDGGGEDTSAWDVLAGVYAFSFQIYGDFSGYSNIARGISKWLGYELVVNFNNPYLAVNPSDFWRRWHISLSTWLRDYLYIPLGGNRGGTLRTYRNLMLTMFLGGLWHGAAWTYIAWGTFQGLVLCAYHALGWRDTVPGQTLASRLRWLASVVIMFHITCVAWFLFRADSIPAAIHMTGRLAADWHVTDFALASLVMILFHAGPMFLWESLVDGEEKLAFLRYRHWLIRAFLLAYLLVMLLIFHAEKAYEFIYFQF